MSFDKREHLKTTNYKGYCLECGKEVVSVTLDIGVDTRQGICITNNIEVSPCCEAGVAPDYPLW